MKRVQRRLWVVAGLLCALVLSGSACSPSHTVESTNHNEDQREEQSMDALSLSAMRLTVNDTEVSVEWEEVDATHELLRRVAHSPLTLTSQRYQNFEQITQLDEALPSNDTWLTSHPGDIFLYQGDHIIFFFGENSWSYTRLGRVSGMSDAELSELLNQPTTLP